MLQTHIFLTQTYLDENKLSFYLAASFFQNFNFTSSLVNTQVSYSDDQLVDIWHKYQASGQILRPTYDDKEKFTDSLLDLYKNYPNPCLLFLGNLSNYSLPMQEGMLKLLEEPPRNLHIVLYSQTKSIILPTINSRSQIHILPNTFVLKYLEPSLLESTKKKLPEIKIFAKELLAGLEMSKIPDVSKVEREELDFWFWQLIYYFEQVYKQNLDTKLAKLIQKLLEAQVKNQNNVQKKFALGWLGV